MVITSTTGNRVAANTARGFESLLLRHVAADVISFAATFLQKSPLTYFVAAPFQTGPAAAGLRFGMPPCGRIWFAKSASFLWTPPARGPVGCFPPTSPPYTPPFTYKFKPPLQVGAKSALLRRIFIPGQRSRISEAQVPKMTRFCLFRRLRTT